MASAAAVAALLGRQSDTDLMARAAQIVPMVEAVVRAYTRDKGFQAVTGVPAPAVDAVIVGASARLAVNAGGVTQETIGTYSATYAGGGAINFTLTEMMVLNGYRERAR